MKAEIRDNPPMDQASAEKPGRQTIRMSREALLQKAVEEPDLSWRVLITLNVFRLLVAALLSLLAALVLSGLVYRELSLGDIVAAIRRAAHTTAVIWAVIAVSKVFSEILVRNLFTDRLLEGISWVTASPTGVLLVMTSMVFVPSVVVTRNRG